MSEETQSGEGQEIEQTQVDPVEEQARAQGWVPEDEYTGTGKWRSAQEFVDRGELFGKIESQNKELKAIRETLAQFKDHHSKVQEAAYKKAIADLKAKKKEALVEGDADLVIEVDEQLHEVKQQQQRAQQEPAQQVPQMEHPEFVAFKSKNGWYESNKAMRGWADGRGIELQEQGKSPSEILGIISREVREEFKSKFENPNRQRAGAVEGITQRGRAAADHIELSADQRTAMNKFVKAGLMTEKEYMDELRLVLR